MMEGHEGHEGLSCCNAGWIWKPAMPAIEKLVEWNSTLAYQNPPYRVGRFRVAKARDCAVPRASNGWPHVAGVPGQQQDGCRTEK